MSGFTFNQCVERRGREYLGHVAESDVRAAFSAAWISDALGLGIIVPSDPPNSGVDDSPDPPDPEPAPDDAVVKVTQAAMALIERHGLDITEIDGTGTDGRVTKADVERLLEGFQG